MRDDIIKSKLKIIEENIDLVKENLPENIEEFSIRTTRKVRFK